MAISLVGTGSFVAGTTSVNPVSPSGNTGDALVRFIGNKPYTSTPSTPSGWTNYATITSGTIANGNGTGSVRATVFYRQATSSSTFSGSSSVSSGSPSMGQIMRFSKHPDATWTVNAIGFADPLESSTTVAAGTVGPADWIKAGDWLAVSVVMRDDIVAHSNQSLYVAGCTLDTISWNVINTTTTGNDGAMQLGYTKVLSGSATGDITYNATSNFGNYSSCSVNLVSLREVGAPANGTVIKAGDNTWSGILKTHDGSSWVPRVVKRDSGGTWTGM